MNSIGTVAKPSIGVVPRVDGANTQRNTPVLVSGVSGAVDLAAGFSHTCALESDGDVVCWGENSDGQLGDGTNTDRLVPTAPLGL